MAFQRIFLGHDRPALHSAVDWLLAEYTRGEQVDLRQVAVVVPGSRAGRRLLELLVESAAVRGQCLTPPLIETVGAVGEQLYRPQRSFASDLVQRLVWADVLRHAGPEILNAVVPHPPAGQDRARWLTYGELLRRQHVELAADGLHFGDVAAQGASLDGFNAREELRWQALQRLQRAYLDRLDGLELWDRQTARLEAVRRKECRTDLRVVLLGTADLNVTLRRMLEQVSGQVTALIFAPEDWRDRFDEHGCLLPAAWEGVDVPIATEQVHVVDRPADQAEEVVRQLAARNGRYRGDELVIGVPDEALVPDLERRLVAAGVTARWGPGLAFSRTPPLRLLAAVAAFLERPEFAALAALARHPDAARWIEQTRGISTDWLEQLDDYQNRHLPWNVADEAPAAQSSQNSWWRIRTAVQDLLGELEQRERPLASWGSAIWALLIRGYGQHSLDLDTAPERIAYTVCSRVREVLLDHAAVPPAIMPSVTASQAIGWLLDALRNETIPPPLTSDSVELLGWLELPLDDAPVLLVTGFNEGQIPQSLNSDLFMPNALRQRLGLLDNARRYARDAYAVSVLTASRPVVQFIVERRNHDGDPQVPSRLLFACDPDTTVPRARQFFQPIPASRTPSGGPGQLLGEGGLLVPRPIPMEQPLQRLRVTAFRDYLGCPYRFYLRHIEKLQAVRDSRDELDGGGFGNLAHEVLKGFGRGPHRDSSDAEQIEGALEEELDRCAAAMFGGSPLPAVLVQVEQLRWRLRAFAARQAEWCRQGWRIKWVEVAMDQDTAAPLEVDGKPFWLTGRIDRIDFHEETGRYSVLDYKTSDAGKSTRATHQAGGDWIDLQLPLYRHLVTSLQITEPVELGYIVLPKDTTATDFVLADWDPTELLGADACAREVVRAIRQQRFWPPAESPPNFSDDFDPICQTSVLARIELGDEQGGGWG